LAVKLTNIQISNCHSIVKKGMICSTKTGLAETVHILVLTMC